MPDNNQITDVFFDLDHTLWDFERNSALTFKKIFGELKIDLNLAMIFLWPMRGSTITTGSCIGKTRFLKKN